MGKAQTVPYETDSRLNLFQAINCLATFIRSVRDKRQQLSNFVSKSFEWDAP